MSIPSVFTIGRHNAITEDGIFTDIPTTITFVSQAKTKDDLPALIPDAEPGDFAATYAFTKAWQYNGEEWLNIFGDEEEEE